jgi:glutamyl-Q tRNA(Asp) synthetase
MPTPSNCYRGRFAPSPTGDLHFGSLVAAVGSWLRARQQGGTWIVRIEDLDPPREVPGSAARIVDTLAAFGLVSDEPVMRQSDRQQAYERALELLLQRSALFACTCSRSDLGPGAMHRGACLSPPDASRNPALRVRVDDATIGFDDAVQGPQRQDLGRDVGDFVVRRVEGYFAYHLAVVVDDAAQGITEIVRGADLLDSTPRQIFLQRLLNLPTPRYAHLPLALDESGAKLSKQSRSAPVDPRDPLPALWRALRFLGLEQDDGRSSLSTPQALLEACVDDFDLHKVPAQRARPIDDPDAAAS